ncbi:MAG: SCO family protein [Nevskiaceae bacterium]
MNRLVMPAKAGIQGLLLTILLCAAGSAVPATPGDSLYQMQVPLTNQADKPVKLDLHAGSPVLVTMFYGSCPHVCPMLISTIQRYELELPEKSRGHLRVLLVSLDPERDTPAKLAEVAQRHRVDLSRWTLARAEPKDVRRLAAALNIQYRQLPDGEFNHSTIITLLDAQGRMVKQTSSLLRLEPEFTGALKVAAGR